jgi:hypothetical protein
MSEIMLPPKFEITRKETTVSESLFTEIWDLLPDFVMDEKSPEFLAMIIEKSAMGFSE